MPQLTTTQGLPQWEVDLLTAPRPAPTTPHTCLAPHGQVYVCLRLKIVWDWRSSRWHLTCLEPGCGYADSDLNAFDLADRGRSHTAGHGGRS